MSARPERLRIAFSGMLAGDPHQGGASWAVLQYVLGLLRLGHDVLFIEPVQRADAEVADYFRSVVGDFGLTDRAALLVDGSRETVGLPYERVRDRLTNADLLLNVSGMLADEDLLAAPHRRVYLDLDPAFNQLWHEAEGIDVGFDRHERFVTVGLALGDPECPVPTGGRAWITTPQPVVLSHWPRAAAVERDALTTVGNWRGYGSIEWEGRHLGQKAHSLRRFFELPARTDELFELALAIHPDEGRDLAALRESGWTLVDPALVAGTPSAYQRFVAGSKAELGIAKSGYVESRCGWFSDRSVCYLASGRPVVAQDTGFARHLPTGAGVLAFTTLEDALTAIEELNRDYEAHSDAARAVAEDVFDSQKVLPALLERIGASG
ncbi:MAG: glycosyltransferase [Thermoleophilaceae bacterium]